MAAEPGQCKGKGKGKGKDKDKGCMTKGLCRPGVLGAVFGNDHPEILQAADRR